MRNFSNKGIRKEKMFFSNSLINNIIKICTLFSQYFRISVLYERKSVCSLKKDAINSILHYKEACIRGAFRSKGVLTAYSK